MLRPKSTHGYIPGKKWYTRYTRYTRYKVPGRPGKKGERGKHAFIDNYLKFSVLEKIAEDFLAAKVILTALIMMLKVVK